MSIILTCNAGSTNTKLAAFDAATLERKAHTVTHSAAETIEWLCSVGTLDIVAIGHRVVHGGPTLTASAPLTSEVMLMLKGLIPLAPLHQPAALKLIEETRKLYPTAPQVACFDTGFHRTMPEIERRLPLPRWFHDHSIQRYGFHGLSYQHVADMLPSYAGIHAEGRIIAVHLGGGASACAMHHRKSVASTMGFSTLDGMMMGTRCGAVDPGIILYLIKDLEMSIEEVHRLLYLESGLQGVSGISADMRDLIASDAPKAQEAIELYCYLAAKQIAGLLPALGGLDALVFTGGIGENNPSIRQRITAQLQWLGDVPVHVITANEELVIATNCRAILRLSAAA